MPRPKIVHSVKTIQFSLIDRNPNQPRQKFREDKLRELAASILNNGLAQLASVKANPDNERRYIIVTGERRWRALQMAGLLEYQFTVLTGELGSSYDLSVVENRHRVDLNFIEEAEVMRRYIDEGRTMEEVMRVTGYSDFTIYKRLELLDLHPDVQAMIIEGKLTSVKALRLHKTPLADQIKTAHLLINATPLDFEEEELQKHRKARKVRSSVDHPSDVLLSRVMQFAWRSRSAAGYMESLLLKSPMDFAALFMKINATSRLTLETRFGELAEVSEKCARQLRAMRLKMPPFLGQSEEEKPEPAKPARTPIHFSSERPPENFGISRQGKARAEECGIVLGYLLCNPERHGRVNLSKARLKSVLALPSDRNPEDLALGILRVAWASWEMNPKGLQPGAQRQFLERVVHLREVFGNSFPDAMNAAWSQDSSADPVDLAKLVAVSVAAA